MTIQVVVAVVTNDVGIADVFGTDFRFWDRVFTYTSNLKRFKFGVRRGLHRGGH